MGSRIVRAIKAINPDAQVTVNANDFNQITWHPDTPAISREDIEAKMAELAIVEVNTKYQRDREKVYPKTQEFLEAYTEKEILGDSTKWDAYVVKYNQVRSDNQKP
tara:strand:- start:67 stop:384 length:318 start_codon:yes stop_codon:yes gene_type:complete